MASSSSSSPSSWMPTKGRHSVNIGTSLARALKARKQKDSAAATNTKKSNLPDRDFYSFRYNFKPSMIDPNKPGTIEINKGKDLTSITVEHPSTQDGEAHVFRGVEHSAKEWDCVLIYDEETGTYTLEKLDSFMVLKFERKVASSAGRPATPSPPMKPAPAKPTPRTYEEQLEHDLLDMQSEDADGEVEDDIAREIMDENPEIYKQEEEEEEDEEEIYIPPRPPSPPKPQPPPPLPQKSAPRPVKPVPKRKEPPPPQPRSQKPLPPPVAVPAPSTSSKITRPPAPKPIRKPKPDPAPVLSVLSEPEEGEEVLEFGKPAKKRARQDFPPAPAPAPTPVAKPSGGLELPGTSSSFAPPPPLPSVPRVSASSSSRQPPAPAPPPSIQVETYSESDEDWDEVQPDPSTLDDAAGMLNDVMEEEDDFNIFGDEPEEIDVNEFEMEINQQMEESDEDFLAAAVGSADSPEPEGRQPISMNQLAGAAGGESEDDYTSSEESDDD